MKHASFPNSLENEKEFENHYKAKFTCSYGGDILPRANDNRLSYVGGHTKILYVHRSIKFSNFIAKLSALSSSAATGGVSFKYQLPGDDDLDDLISVTDENDLHNMMLEYDHLYRASPARARMRLFLFPNNNNPIALGSDPNPNPKLPIEVRASSSSFCSLNPSIPGKYDVFISFRGKDTRTKFICHLYEALTQKQIRSFMDCELHKGDEISPSLFGAIRGSSVSVVVFSENYASSKWCLEELVEILECRKKLGQNVIPVFYGIDPSQVRKQEGRYKEAFEKHLQNPMVDMNRIQKWKDALTEAANLAGWDSDSRSYRDDYEFIQKIVEDVLQKLEHRYPPYNFKSLVGISENYTSLESLLRDAQSIGIWGMGGIGKTTVARYLFDKYSRQYDGFCFLENVRERSGKHGQGLCELRNLLYSNLLRNNNKLISAFVEHRLRRQRNFIVLDDVSSSEQVEYLVGELQSFDASSRIIITTRDKSILQNRRVQTIYELEGLNFPESLTLLSMNAFNEDRPKMGYEELSQRAVSYCKGVPLALVVLGSFLHSKSEIEWDCKLRKLERIPDEGIQNVLRLSYDELNYEEKQIFLDIACFFKGELEHHLIKLFDSWGFYADISMRSLRDKALIKICSSGSIWMHDLTQEMGWEIIRQESIQNPGKRSRLWVSDDICDVLKNNKGTNAIQGIKLDLSQSEQSICLSVDTFKRMSELRFLKVYTSNSNKGLELVLPIGLDSFSNNLRYLEWYSYPAQSLPSILCPEKLVTLRFHDAKLKRLWGGIQNLVNLKELDLIGCKNLMELPDFSRAQNLKIVSLAVCEKLKHVHPSILSLDKLDELDLVGCVKLETLESENSCRSLRHLKTNGCSSLAKLSLSSKGMESLYLERVGGVEGLQASMGRLIKLANLYINECRLENLSKDLSFFKSLEKLILIRCKGGIFSKQNLFVMFDGFHSLRELYLEECEDLSELPNNLGHLSSLEVLNLDGSKVVMLPESIKHLSLLDTLSLRNCRWLHSLPELPSSIICLNALNCHIIPVSSMDSKAQEQEFKSSSSRDINSFHQYLRELAHGYELKRREGMDSIFYRKIFSICYKGYRVPEWFTYRTKGSSISFELA